jgi:hypothetical protein
MAAAAPPPPPPPGAGGFDPFATAQEDQEAEAHRGPALFSNDELEQRLIATVFTAAVNRMRIPAYRERCASAC